MATRTADSARNAANDAVVDRIDLGAAAGVIELRTGVQPADADDADAGTLLVECTLGDPAYGASAAGSAALTQSAVGTGVAAGDAGHFRVKDSDGNKVFDGTVTGTGGGGDIELDNVNIAVGQTVTISSLDFSTPASE